jgi:hypothetical protein
VRAAAVLVMDDICVSMRECVLLCNYEILMLVNKQLIESAKKMFTSTGHNLPFVTLSLAIVAASCSNLLRVTNTVAKSIRAQYTW